ncbi:kinase-like domain-containing protein [Pestalotiopsis sp. NC0098]|nr:kinase-like domain-containing protein [Pestalotiopsis sp. NC0098]
MAGRSLLSDLVHDSKIETQLVGSCIQHTFYDTGSSAKQRRVRREERWVRQKFVGQGAYGRVYLEQCETGGSSRLRAVKEIKKSVTIGEEIDYVRELEAVAKFSHQKYAHCFVQSHGWFELEDSIFVSMEYLHSGDLQRYLQNPLPESEAKQITAQVLEGLTYMHENGFVHRDLKPGNIMVVTRGPDWFVKITDFGISKRRLEDVTTLHTMQRGTIGFVAPEVLELLPNDSYTFSVDMWSLGAVVYRIITNATAFRSVAELFKFANGISPFPSYTLEEIGTSQEAQDFVVNLMRSDPRERLTAASATIHPWIGMYEQKGLTMSLHEGQQSATNGTMDSVASRAWSIHSGLDTVSTGSPIKSVDDTISSMSDLTIAINPMESEAKKTTATGVPSMVSDDPEIASRHDSVSKESPGNSPASSTAVTETMRAPGFGADIKLDSLAPTETTIVSQPELQSDKSSSASLNKDEIKLGDSIHRDAHQAARPEQVENSTQVERICKCCLTFIDLSKSFASPDMQNSAPSMTQLPCGHWICLKCLLERVALALISPKHMPLRCGEEQLDCLVLDWVDSLVSSEVSHAYKLLETIQKETRQEPRTCPRCHDTTVHVLEVQKNISTKPRPAWTSPVECTRCYSSADFRLDWSISKIVPRSEYCYCLFCTEAGSSCRCREWLDTTIQSLVDFLKHNGILSDKVLTELQCADEVRGIMKEPRIRPPMIIGWSESARATTLRYDLQILPKPKEPQGRGSAK